MRQSELKEFLGSFLPIRQEREGAYFVLLNDLMPIEETAALDFKVTLVFQITGDGDLFRMAAYSDLKLPEMTEEDAGRLFNAWNLERGLEKVVFAKSSGFVIVATTVNPAELSRECLKSFILKYLHPFWTFFVEAKINFR